LEGLDFLLLFFIICLEGECDLRLSKDLSTSYAIVIIVITVLVALSVGIFFSIYGGYMDVKAESDSNASFSDVGETVKVPLEFHYDGHPDYYDDDESVVWCDLEYGTDTSNYDYAKIVDVKINGKDPDDFLPVIIQNGTEGHYDGYVELKLNNLPKDGNTEYKQFYVTMVGVNRASAEDDTYMGFEGSIRDDSMSGTVSIEDYTYFEVSKFEDDQNVTEGERVNIYAQFKNTGDKSGEVDAKLKIGGDVVESETFNLSAGESEHLSHYHTFNSETKVEAITEDETKTATISTKEPESNPAYFRVWDMNIDPSSINVDESTMIDARVSNTGDESGSQEIVLRVSGSVQDRKNLSLSGGSSERLSFSYTGQTDGDHSVKMSSNDDSVSGSLSVQSSDDGGSDSDGSDDSETSPAYFDVSNIEANPSTLQEGDSTELQALVKNTGDESATQDVIIKVDGERVHEETETLSSGDWMRVNTDYNPSSEGGHNFEISSDDDAQSSSFTVESVEFGHLDVSDVSADPEVVDVGQSTTISAKVVNSGQKTTSQDVSIKVGDEVVETKTVELEGGNDETVSAVFSADSVGEYDVVVSSDDDESSGVLVVDSDGDGDSDGAEDGEERKGFIDWIIDKLNKIFGGDSN